MEDGIDRLKDAVLHGGGEGAGLSVIDHAGVGFVAALLQDFLCGDVAGDVVAVACDHEIVLRVF